MVQITISYAYVHTICVWYMPYAYGIKYVYGTRGAKISADTFSYNSHLRQIFLGWDRYSCPTGHFILRNIVW